MNVPGGEAVSRRPLPEPAPTGGDPGRPRRLVALNGPLRAAAALRELPLEAFGELTPISRLGGQGRVYRPAQTPMAAACALVVKLYRRAPPAEAARVLTEMVAWRGSLDVAERARLDALTAWPLRVVSSAALPVGIVMQDVTPRFLVPFVMPSGRSAEVLLALEHLLGADSFLRSRGLDVALDTVTRARIAERISATVGFLHRHGIVASDIAPSNVLVSFRAGAVAVCLIDCDSMVFRGRQALASVETGDWDIPAEFGEPPLTRAADAYKLGLVVLRLFARSHDARSLAPHLRHVPVELRDLLYRALAPDAANRPPAGEWQRALNELLANRYVNERYPGPAPAVRLGPLPATGAPASAARAPVGSGPGGVPVGATPQRLGAGLARPRRAAAAPAVTPAIAAALPPMRVRALRVAVMFLWLFAIAIVAGLVISRVFAATVPTQTPIGIGSGVPGAGSGQQQYGYGGYGNPYAPGASQGGAQITPQGSGLLTPYQ